MILNDALRYNKNEKTPKECFPIYSFWDMVDLKCEKSEKCGKNIFFRLISMKFFLGTIQTILRIFFFIKKFFIFLMKKPPHAFELRTLVENSVFFEIGN